MAAEARAAARRETTRAAGVVWRRAGVAALLLVLATGAGPAAAAQWYTHYERGVELAAAGRCAEALEDFAQAERLGPGPQARVRTYGSEFLFAYDPAYRRAACLAQLGRWEEGLALLPGVETAAVTARADVTALRQRLEAQRRAAQEAARRTAGTAGAAAPTAGSGEGVRSQGGVGPPTAPADAARRPGSDRSGQAGAARPAGATGGSTSGGEEPVLPGSGSARPASGEAAGAGDTAAGAGAGQGPPVSAAGAQGRGATEGPRASPVAGPGGAGDGLVPSPSEPGGEAPPGPPATGEAAEAGAGGAANFGGDDSAADPANAGDAGLNLSSSRWVVPLSLVVVTILVAALLARRRGSGATGAGRRLGRYRLLAEIGRGGMATTWRARRSPDGATVAVKIPHAGGDSSYPERFLREGRLGERLHHPNLVRILDVGDDDGTLYLVMELVPGRTLQAELAAAGTAGLPLPRVLEIVTAIAEALDYAHGKGVVHRDLKPENVMVLPGGAVKVLDLGVARLEGQAGLTTSQVFFGSPLYAAPELVEPRRVDGRSDLYSLGAMFFEMVAGRPPFVHESVFRLLELHQHAPLPQPASLPRTVPAEVWALLERLLAKDPAARPASAEALLVELRRLRLAAAGAGDSTPAVSAPAR